MPDEKFMQIQETNEIIGERMELQAWILLQKIVMDGTISTK